MKIGLDLDGVIGEFEQHFLTYLDLPKHGATHWDDSRFVDNMHLIKDDADFWLSMPTIFPANLLEFTPEVYVTARPIRTDITVAWLNSHNFPKSEVITVGHNGSKIEALKGRVDLFLDDSIRNYIELNKEGIPTILVTRSHNRSYTVPKNRRVKNLLDFQNRFLQNEDLLNHTINNHYLATL